MSDKAPDDRSDREVFITDAIESAAETGVDVRISWTNSVSLRVPATNVRIHRGGIVIEYRSDGDKLQEMWAPLEAILFVGVMLNG